MSEMEQVAELQVPIESLKHSQIENDAISQLIDVYCELRQKLDPKIAALKIETKDLEFVEKELLESIDQLNEGGDEGTMQTLKFLLQFSKKGNAFKVEDKKKLIEFLGIDQFLEIAEVSVMNMRKYLTKDQLALVGKDVPSTKRKLTYAVKTDA